jgi:Zn-dependent protease with chaperone function
MIHGSMGLALNMLTAGVISLVVALFLVCALSRFALGSAAPFHACAKRRLLWSLVAMPWVASIFSVTLLVLPELYQKEIYWMFSSAHFHHVYDFDLFSWHGLSLLLFCTFFLVLFSRKLRRAVRMSIDLYQLNCFAQAHSANKTISVLQTELPLAFSSGFLRPRVYLTTGLIEKLNEQERDIIERHELAHTKQFDPLLKYVFSLLSAFFPRSIEDRLNRTMTLAIEQSADETVLKQVRDEALISRTILKVVRLCNEHKVQNAPSLVSCQFVGDQLDQRIHYLMNKCRGRSFPRWSFMLLACLLVASGALSVDVFHHTIESVFSH